MCLVKSPSAQLSTPSASSKYTRRPSLAFQVQQQVQDQDTDEQGLQLPVSLKTLARQGIKVRDFAYESNLPLIPSIPRVRQLVLATRPLKRTKRYFEQSDDVFAVDTRSQSQNATAGLFQAPSLELEQQQDEFVNKSRPLERKSTEPLVIPEREPQRPYRDVGYADLSQRPSGSQASQRSLHYTLTPITPTAVNRTSTFSPASLPFPFPTTKGSTALGSQESELSTDTPLVTPKGSLTWPTITSDVPISQLDNNSSQVPFLVQDTTTYSQQLGSSSSFSQALSDTGAGDAASSLRPTEVAASPPQPLLDLDYLDNDDDAHASSSPSPTPRRRAARTPTDLGQPLTPNAGARRYFLRKHGSPRLDHASSASSPHRRRKPSTKAPAPYPGRVPPITRQAVHAAASGSSGRSPRARPLRKTNV